jgi:uncharacterized membrane protein
MKTKLKKRGLWQKELYLILFLAFILRLPLLNGSFWMDEAAQALEIIRPLSQQLDIVADFQPPLLHLILHFAQYFSHAEWWLRTIGALIPGLVTIFFSYKLAEKLFNKNVAIISSLLLSTSSFHIFYSQELRPYSLPTMFALISSYYFFQLTKKEPPKKNSKNPNKIKTKLSIANLLGLYSSYLFPFLMIGQLSFAIISDFTKFKKLKSTIQYLKAQTIPIVGFLFWIPTFLQQLEAGNLVRKNLPGWEKVVSTPQIKAIPLIFGKFIFGNLDIEPNQYFIIFGFLVLAPMTILLSIKLKNQFKNKEILANQKNMLFLLSWLVLPLLTSWLVSFVVPVVSPKRLLYLLPAFYILISFLITSSLNKTKFKTKKLDFTLGLTLLLAISLINLFSTLSYYTNPKIQRENWRSLHQEITEDFSPSNSIIIYSFPEKFAPMVWYDQQNFPSIVTGKLFIDNVDDLANTLKIVVEYDNVLVFDYLRDLSDPEKKIEKELINFGLKEVDTLDYPNIGFVRVFSKPYSLIGAK